LAFQQQAIQRFRERARAIQHGLEGSLAALGDQRIRVFPRRQGGQLQAAFGADQRQGGFRDSGCGASAGGIAIKTEHRFGRQAP
jgi:hypothetical protein